MRWTRCWPAPGWCLTRTRGVYHLVVATFQQLPRSLELMGQMRARGSALLAAGGVPEPATRARFENLNNVLEGQAHLFSSSLARSGAGDGGELGGADGLGAPAR
jgi:hypothetical protein